VRRVLPFVLCVAALAAFAARAQAQTLPPTLTGEFFSDVDVQMIGGTCDPSGTSTITYYTSGVATGPYPGTYTESGTATIGPASGAGFVNGFELGTITTIDAFFTIDSPIGQVTGTKHLTVAGTGQSACYQVQSRPFPDGTLFTGTFRRLCSCGATFLVAYDATIKTVDGTFGDSGGSDLLLEQFEGTVSSGSIAPTRAFNEAFRSDLLAVVPVASSGQVTGGGQAGSAVFGLTAKADAKGTKGECTVVDQSSDTKVKCLTATTFVQSGNHATIIGSATVNGAPATYRIDVFDNAEPGRDADSFVIQTSTGYTAGGTLTEGNIQLHG
jgi:hypothetical protein